MDMANSRVLLDVRMDKTDFNVQRVMDIFCCDEYIYIPFDELVDNQNLECYLDKTKDYYVVCNSGNKSKYVVDMLNSLGFRAFNIEGGFKALESTVI